MHKVSIAGIYLSKCIAYMFKSLPHLPLYFRRCRLPGPCSVWLRAEYLECQHMGGHGAPGSLRCFGRWHPDEDGRHQGTLCAFCSSHHGQLRWKWVIVIIIVIMDIALIQCKSFCRTKSSALPQTIYARAHTYTHTHTQTYTHTHTLCSQELSTWVCEK